jgi:hypothetical protein
MKAQVLIFLWKDGGESFGPPIALPLATAEFDITGFIGNIGHWIIDYESDNYVQLANDTMTALSRLMGDVKDFKNGTVSFGQGGSVGGHQALASYGIVYFHTWTGDDIKPSFGKVDHLSTIRDLGETRYTRGDFQYEYRFRIPFATIGVGKYTFAFGTGDSGTFQDAEIGYTVGMEITPAAAQPDIQAKYMQLDGPGGWLGNAAGPETPTPDGIGRFRHFDGGSIYWTPGRGAHEVHGAIREKWASLGWETGVLGYPITDETPTPDGQGRYNNFQGGSIHWTPGTGAHEVHGAIREKWASLGWETSFLGYPITDELTLGDGSRYNNYQGGSIRWTPRLGAEEAHAQIKP